jgi:nitrogen fixation NifU-like protein
MPAYSEKVMEYFMNPRNVGEIEDADGIGEEGNPVCGDMMTFYIKVDGDERLSDVKFKTFGCGAAIAVSSMVSEMAKGKTIEEAKKITPKMVADELGGLPKQKFHCSNLGAQALNKAIDDYEARKEGKAPVVATIGSGCSCPNCGDNVLDDGVPECRPCQSPPE